MKFLLSDDQIQLQDAVARFAADTCAAGARRSAFEGETGFDAAFWDGLMALGAGAVSLPLEHGGLGLELLDLALIVEAIGYEAGPGPFLGHVLAGHALSRWGSPTQQAEWIPKLASGATIATVALVEAGSETSHYRWITDLDPASLNGQKAQSPNAELAELLIVGLRDGGLALVAKGAEVGVETCDDIDRTRRLSNVTFKNAAAELLPGGRVDDLLDAARVLVAADAFGGARRCLDMSTAYAKEREQFGRAIGSFQAVKHQLANLAVSVEPARGLYWYAAHAYDRGLEDRAKMASLAKAHLADVFMQAARVMIEVHGGLGYTWEHDAHIWFRRAMFDFAWLGTPQVHRARSAQLSGW